MTGSPGGSIEVDKASALVNSIEDGCRHWSDRPSVEFRLRDALTFLASSSLGPAGSPTGGTERVLALPAIAGWLRVSGMKRVRIFGTDTIATVGPRFKSY